ncbi:MAG: hypothetical protein KTR20_04380 [Cellvibrionaceae bacterium]|nr:hypothetical protein [Cellvibrionaceae bacterium]
MELTAFYDAATSAGMLTEVMVAGNTVMCEFRAPDESVLDGLALSTDYAIRYPVSRLPNLLTGETVVIAGKHYLVREVRALADGTERRATLTKL